MTVETVKQAPRTSPLGTYADRLAALPGAVRVGEVPFLTQLDVRVPPGSSAAVEVARIFGVALPTTPCTRVCRG